MGNILAGALEAIPLVGTGLYFYRSYRTINHSDASVKIYTGYENKFMPYSSLEAMDWKFSGEDDIGIDELKGSYQQKIVDAGGEDSLSPEEMLEIARDLLRY